MEVDGVDIVTSGLRDVRDDEQKLETLLSSLKTQEDARRRGILTTVNNLLWDNIFYTGFTGGRLNESRTGSVHSALAAIAVALINFVLRRLHVVVLNSTFVYNNTVCDSVLATTTDGSARHPTRAAATRGGSAR